MDALSEFLETVGRLGLANGNLLGLLHLLIGRRLEKADGTLLSQGVTWRTLAGLLKKVRWDREAVRELGLDPADLPPRDRERYWYTAILQARVDSDEAAKAGDRLAAVLKAHGYHAGPSPRP